MFIRQLNPGVKCFFITLIMLLVAGLSLMAGPSSQAETIPPDLTPGNVYLPLVKNNVLTATATPLGTDTIMVKSSRTFLSPDGTVRHVVGEVLNDFGSIENSVQVQAQFFDSANKLVTDAASYTMLPGLLANQVSPFDIVLPDAPPSIVRYELAVQGGGRIWYNYQSLTVISRQVRDNHGIEIYGEIRNETEGEVDRPVIVATFYDAAGNVVNVANAGEIMDIMAQDQTIGYTISTFSDFDYASYIIQAQSFLRCVSKC